MRKIWLFGYLLLFLMLDADGKSEVNGYDSFSVRRRRYLGLSKRYKVSATPSARLAPNVVKITLFLYLWLAAEQAISGMCRSRGRPGSLQASRFLSHGCAGVGQGSSGLSLHHREDVGKSDGMVGIEYIRFLGMLVFVAQTI